MNEKCYSKSKLSPIFAPVKVLVIISVYVCVTMRQASSVRMVPASSASVNNFFMPKFGGMEKMVYLCSIKTT